MRMYETVRKREAEQALLPDGLRKKIQHWARAESMHYSGS